MFARAGTWLSGFKELLYSNKSYKTGNRVIAYNVKSSKALADLLSAAYTAGDKKSFLGINKSVGKPYFKDFKFSTDSKNIFVMESSQYRKNSLILSWILDFYALNYNLCIMNLKGNDVSSLMKVFNGITIPLGSNLTKYVNTFKLKASEAENYTEYFDTRIKLSKGILHAISNLSQSQYGKGEELFEDFLDCLYSLRGITKINPKTWKRSEGLTPYVIYNEFIKFMTTSRLRYYADVADTILHSFDIYLNPKGKMAFMFKEEFVPEDIFESKAIAFDFGTDNPGGTADAVTDKLRLMYADILSNEYHKYKASKKQWIFKVIEESGISEDFNSRIYTKEIVERHSRYKVTALISKSVRALVKNYWDNAFEVIDMLCIGRINDADREYIVDKLQLQEQEYICSGIKDNSRNQGTFLLVDKLDKYKSCLLLQAYIDPRLGNSEN